MLVFPMASSPFYAIFLFLLHVLLFPFPLIFCTASDCLEEGSMITDGTNNSNLVSPGKVFELGFFTPEVTNNTTRYMGIWYYQSNPKLVVWVANRNKPLLESSGSLVLKNGDAVLSDTKRVIYWLSQVANSSANIITRPCTNHTACARTNVTYYMCLSDNGNLISNKKGSPRDTMLWQSFDHPTNTFLPGMGISQGQLYLTSGETSNDPKQGEYNFTLQFQGNNQKYLIIMKMGSLHYWESDVKTFDPPPQNLFDLLSNNVSNWGSYNTTRLVMNSNGQIQFWNKESGGGWSLRWSEPKDMCSLYNACGNFGSCNSKNGLLCKCLPGFKASSPKKWNSGYFSEGCSPRSVIPCSRNYSADLFLRMPMMKVRIPDRNDTYVKNCTDACLQDCSCLAYSCGAATCSGTSNKGCLMWYNEPTQLQEEYPQGLTIFIRSQHSDIESTPRDCKPCGAYIIPYPLSTAADCGDLSYSNFHCNTTTGQVNFSSFNRTFKVDSIDQVTKRFSIQIRDLSWCHNRSTASFILSPNDSILYSVKNCNVIKEQPFSEVQQSFIAVEIGWNPPPEPLCNVSTDCNGWQHSTCKASSTGETRCICESKYDWNGETLQCTKKAAFPIKIVLPSIAGALALIIFYGICFIYQTRKRRGEGLGSNEFRGDDSEGIDVPLFEWGSILAATDGFSEANKLGKGGFGAVFKGTLPDGKDIAVKRLSKGSAQGIQEFKTEVVLIARLQHRNLVRLLGYCVKEDEKILVYEFMPNGSLDYFLFDDSCSKSLNWKTRFDIILGVARGLLYLHQDSRLRIIHRDLKPSNILLDEELNPKIADFGIARIVGGNETEASTNKWLYVS